MPIHEYECSKCGHVDEAGYGWTENIPETRKCPKCGGRARKIISLTSKPVIN